MRGHVLSIGGHLVAIRDRALEEKRRSYAYLDTSRIFLRHDAWGFDMCE
jgi:hypothetical protein